MIIKNYLQSGVDVNKSNDCDITNIDPVLASKIPQFVSECKKIGINVIITQGYRTPEYQNGLFAIGRIKPGKVVTNCKAGMSPHVRRWAFDFAPLEKNNSINWSTFLNPKWKRCGEIAEKIGLEWGGRWKSFPDSPHAELPGSSVRAFNLYQKGK